MLRIVGGTLSGRRFAAPTGDRTRPTTDRVREALGSALEARGAIVGSRVLDLYAGSGALSFEALSRGASSALLVEADAKNIKLIERNAAQLGLAKGVRTLRVELGRPRSLHMLRAASSEPFSLVFADPPYADVAAISPLFEQLLGAGLLAPRVRVVLEHAHKTPPSLARGFVELGHYRYGDTGVKLWGRADEER